MKATAKATTSANISISMKQSGADVLKNAFKFSKTIGQTVAAKQGLSGTAKAEYAAKVQRTLRRVRIALESVA